VIREAKVPIKKVKQVNLNNPVKKRKSQRDHRAINPNQKLKRVIKRKKHKILKTNKVQSLRKMRKSKKNTIQRKMNRIHLKTKERREGRMLRIIRS